MQRFGVFLFAIVAAAQSISFSSTATVIKSVTDYVTVTTCPCTTTTAPTSSPSSATTPTTTLTTGPILPSDTITPGTSTTTPGSLGGSSSISPTSTTTSGLPVVTDDAYIQTIVLHHNVHRTNHSALALTWSPSLADTARIIAQTCKYRHNTTVGGGGYGQNIGAGYPATPLGMGDFITEGLYNAEVNNYQYFGEEPDLNTLNEWGHFTQIVWKSTASVGCYTADCTGSGLQGVGIGVTPFFTVCNYSPPGNFVGQFAPNVGVPIGLPTVHGDYGL